MILCTDNNAYYVMINLFMQWLINRFENPTAKILRIGSYHFIIGNIIGKHEIHRKIDTRAGSRKFCNSLLCYNRSLIALSEFT